LTQNPNPHQTDIDSVIHQDDTETPENNIALVAESNGNGHGRAVVKVPAQANGKRKSVRPNNAPGLTIERRFTRPGEDVYSTVEWELRDAVIANERGEKVFEQKNVEIPKSWTQLATNVVVSKYFRGHLGTPQREHSVRQLIGRVADTMANWGRAMDYFATEADAQTFQDELTHILLHQKAAFNSPVWFNVGLADQPHPQCSACFINSVQDTMESILGLAKTEGMLFKYGSGTGTNLSPIRGSREPLVGGGTASGPVSFMRGFDQFAGAIKSGGKTRRAAKMTILDIDHPDIVDFITSKEKEERKAWALIDAGYSGMFNVPGGAYDSVAFQNANHSVRVTDEFMRAQEQDADWQTHYVLSQKPAGTYKARDLMNMIGQSAHVCGDPGIQYDTTINLWHTCKNTDKIYASNPCCVTGDTLIGVADGRNAVAIQDLVGTEVPVYAHDHATGQTTVSRMWNISIKRHNAPVYRVTLDDGTSFRATDDHLIMLRDGSYRMVRDLQINDSLMPFHSKVLTPVHTRTKRRYYWSGRSWRSQYRAVWQYFCGVTPQGHHIHHRDFNALNDTLANLELMLAEDHNALHGEQMRGDNNPARRLMSAEWRQHISEAVRGAQNGNYGRTHSEETRHQMREKSARRWANQEERMRSGASIKAALAKAKEEGRPVGRPRGVRYERCCPVCRQNFITARVEQIFCSATCRYSPMGLQMCGEKTAVQNRGRALSVAHRAKLSASGQAASNPETKRRTALTSHRNTILKAARLLQDNGFILSLEDWDEMRSEARALGAERVPTAATVAQHFASAAALREEAKLYNHKVVAVEFCSCEDVYDGTVDACHNFAILTSAEASCAAGALNYSGVFVHNSEYMFLNDSACNLASINLMRFRREDHEFDVEAFQHACRILITAQEIIVDNASYPTPRIAENSHDYRPLGLGYANLGALLMARSLPYDSDEGRAYAAAITALMTGAAYHQSSLIARDHGWPFPGYAKNREPFLEVMRMHRAAVDDIAAEHVPDDLLQAARQSWDDTVASGEIHGYRNAQSTVIAPTGTISFLMDADTTGIEPDIAIVKYKNLVGGGVMKIVNNTVPEALQRLGYTPAQRERILAYIDTHDTIEGAPDLKPEHLPIFDCAFKPANGVRSIHYMGHVRMMAAAQPFISGAISKTVNMPNEATPEEIVGTYVEGWKLGLKAIAIYRDGSKRTQPLTTKKAEAEEPQAIAVPAAAPAPVEVVRPLRRKLPDERRSITHKFSIAGHEGYITVGMYEDGTPGEIFLTMSKEGSTISGLMDSFATAISLALQYGVPLPTLVDKFAHTRFEPSGITNNVDIRFAKSIMDYIFRWLGAKFLNRQPALEPSLSNGHGEESELVAESDSDIPQPALPAAETPDSRVLSLTERERETFQNQADAPICTECGSLMVRNGACYKCLNCGSVFGCS
jgi:ribonucleotide reductase alpha subunit